MKDVIISILAEELGSGYNFEDDNTVVLNASAIPEETARTIIMRLEDELIVVIPDEEAEKLHTIKDIVDYITAKKAPKKEEPKKEEK